MILKFAGYDSVEAAEALRNYEVCVPESEAVELDEGEFFDWELKDCRVETVEGREIGAVTRGDADGRDRDTGRRGRREGIPDPVFGDDMRRGRC